VNTSARGRQGEDEAVRFLENAGIRVIERNFRTEGGEIDIIALDGETIVFIEVKSWTGYGIENLEFSISEKKQHKIIETAKFFLSKYRKYKGMAVRFDVIFIARSSKQHQQALPTHLVSAFSENV
jgi:putative endonuclease